MWFFLGVAAIITATLNVIWMVRDRQAKWFRFISLSLTALTMCAEYSLVKNWVLYKDWSALMDVVPGMGKVLWFLVIASILINSISLFMKNDRQIQKAMV